MEIIRILKGELIKHSIPLPEIPTNPEKALPNNE